MLDCSGYGTPAADKPLAPLAVKRRAVGTAHERMLKSDVNYRFSIDMASLKK